MAIASAPLISRRSRTIRRIFALLVAAAGLLDVASAISAPVGARIRDLDQWVPLAVPHVASVVVVQAGILLLFFATQLARGKRRSWLVTVLLLLASALLHMLKGLDVEEAGLSLVLGVTLLWSGKHFRAGSEAPSLRRAFRLAVPLAASPFVYGIAAIWWRSHAVGGWPGFGTAISEIGHRLAWTTGPLRYAGSFGRWFPQSITVMGAVIAAYLLYLVFGPVIASAPHRTASEEETLSRLVRDDADTLSYFLLRDDKLCYVDPEQTSALGYRVIGGVALISGDPVGPQEAWPDLLDGFVAYAHERGWRVAALGAGAEAVPVWQSVGFQTIYLGDEAHIVPSEFSLDGRPIRKVRQACANAERAGFSVEWHRSGDTNPDLRRALMHVSEQWRGEDVERGYSMSLGRLFDPRDPDCVVAVARDTAGFARGFLHFVPAGPDGYSLDVMRRDPDTPSSLNDLLIVRTIEHFRERGVTTVGLNFCFWRNALDAAGDLTPAKRFQRFVATKLGPWFQIESLHRFNKKFFPVWEPRYLAFEAKLSVPAVMLAALRAERLIDFGMLRRGFGGKRLRKMGPPAPAA